MRAAVIREFSRVALLGMVLLPLACKPEGGDGLLSLDILADPLLPPFEPKRLELTGSTGITRTYEKTEGTIPITLGHPMEFQFPGLPAGAVTFTVKTYDGDYCQLGEVKPFKAVIKAGAKTGPLDVTLSSVPDCGNPEPPDGGPPLVGMASDDGSATDK